MLLAAQQSYLHVVNCIVNCTLNLKSPESDHRRMPEVPLSDAELPKL